MATENDFENDYSIYTLVKYLWRRKLIIVLAPLIIGILAALYSLTISNTYLSDTLLSPTKEAQGAGLNNIAGQLGGLASLAGISVGAEGTDNVTVALAILESRKFAIDFVNKHGLKVPLMAGEKWDRESGKLILNGDIFDEENNVWTRESDDLRPAEPTELETFEAFKEILTIQRDQATGLVYVSLEFLSPVLAKDWLEKLVSEVNAEMRERELQTTKKNIEYLEDKVSGIDSVEMRTVFFQLIEEQTKNQMLAEVRTDFVFTTIDPPVESELKFAPSRALICIVAVFLSGFLVVAGYIVMFLVTPRNQ